MDKLYERIDFENGTTPAINDSNLNSISKAIDDIDDRVIEVMADVMEVVPEIQELLEDAEDLVEACQTSADNASTSEQNAQTYAQAAAAGSGGNALEYASNILKLKRDNTVLSEVTIAGGGGGGGVSDYTQLTNKPSINNVTLTGNKTANDLGLAKGSDVTSAYSNIYGISNAYNASTSYAPDDAEKPSMCIDENELYKCLVACQGIKPSTDTRGSWERVSLESLFNNIPPFFDWRNMTRETINLSNSSEWQSYTAQYDGWYQIFNASLSPTVIVTTNTAIGCIKNGTTTVLSLIQIPAVKSNMQTATPLFYFRKGETIRYIANVSAVTGSQSMKMFIWH